METLTWEVPKTTLSSFGLRPPELLVAIWLWNKADRKPGHIDLNMMELRAELGMGQRGIANSLRKLVDRGLILLGPRYPGRRWSNWHIAYVIDPGQAAEAEHNRYMAEHFGASFEGGPHAGLRLARPSDIECWPSLLLLPISRLQEAECRHEYFHPIDAELLANEASAYEAAYRRTNCKEENVWSRGLYGFAWLEEAGSDAGKFMSLSNDLVFRAVAPVEGARLLFA